MPLPLRVLPGILGAGERVAPGEGAENRRDGRMISAPTNHRDPAPGGRTLCAPTKNGGRTGGRNIGPHEKPARVRPPGGTSNRGAAAPLIGRLKGKGYLGEGGNRNPPSPR